MARSTIREAASAPAVAGTPGRIQVGLITPGWGSSGYYSPQVLENAAKDRVWPKGTHVFFDHPSESELFDRPERSVRDLAAVTTEDATWDGTQLSAPADVIGPYRGLVTDPVFVEAVGMSIRAGAETTTGEAEGRKGTIIARLTEGISVDLVTRAGRGGKVLAVLESARAGARETLNRETEALLELAVGDQAWVVDFDPDEHVVVYRREWEDGTGYHHELLRDGYQVTGGTATLAGAPVQVRQTVDYTPTTGTGPATESGRPPNSVPAPAGQPEDHTPTEGHTMGTIQIEESQHSELVEAAGRVPTLETERDAAIQRAETAEAERDRLREAAARQARETAARAIITARATDAGVTFTALETRGLLAHLPVTDDGDLDDAAFTATADEAAATKAEEAGAGRVHGFGAHQSTPKVSEADLDQLDAIFGAVKGA